MKKKLRKTEAKNRTILNLWLEGKNSLNCVKLPYSINDELLIFSHCKSAENIAKQFLLDVDKNGKTIIEKINDKSNEQGHRIINTGFTFPEIIGVMRLPKEKI